MNHLYRRQGVRDTHVTKVQSKDIELAIKVKHMTNFQKPVNHELVQRIAEERNRVSLDRLVLDLDGDKNFNKFPSIENIRFGTNEYFEFQAMKQEKEKTVNFNDIPSMQMGGLQDVPVFRLDQPNVQIYSEELTSKLMDESISRYGIPNLKENLRESIKTQYDHNPFAHFQEQQQSLLGKRKQLNDEQNLD
mmetsp:Transcript_7880/g.13210  ORF Transcript_7880/g.13210 Transcript_7880/m.13210 type:complete len:191 (+) Transcript_7880:176-748(+)